MEVRTDFFSMKHLITLSLVITAAFFPVFSTCAQSSPDFVQEQPKISTREAPYQMLAPQFGKLLAYYVYTHFKPAQNAKLPIYLLEDDAGMLAYDFLMFIQQKSQHDKAWQKFYRALEITGYATNEDKFLRMKIRNKDFECFHALRLQPNASILERSFSQNSLFVS